MVPPSSCLLGTHGGVHTMLVKMGTPKVSIVICTYQRPNALKLCLKSLDHQTFKEFEVKLVREKGELAKLRNKGAQGAKGEIISFIDDDVLLPEEWLQGVVDAFSQWQNVGGVSGPAIIPTLHRSQRDLFRWPWIKKVYDRLFLDGKEDLPGHITKAGTWTTGAVKECSYEGSVDFLEACNMSWSKEAFEKVGGFDESYGGIGDWSEPDLAFRVRRAGYRLWFTPRAGLYHLPSRTGAYLSRQQTGARYSNYLRFSRKWVKPCLKHTMYKLFLKSYFTWKELCRLLYRT